MPRSRASAWAERLSAPWLALPLTRFRRTQVARGTRFGGAQGATADHPRGGGALAPAVGTPGGTARGRVSLAALNRGDAYDPSPVRAEGTNLTLLREKESGGDSCGSAAPAPGDGTARGRLLRTTATPEGVPPWTRPKERRGSVFMRAAATPEGAPPRTRPCPRKVTGRERFLHGGNSRGSAAMDPAKGTARERFYACGGHSRKSATTDPPVSCEGHGAGAFCMWARPPHPS